MTTMPTINDSVPDSTTLSKDNTSLKILVIALDFRVWVPGHGESVAEILKVRNKLRVMEDRSRRNNLRIDGIKESENESWVESECKVHKLFEECLDIKNIKIERALRSGPRDVNKHRPIVLKLLNYKDKTEILKKSFKLKEKNIYINEDFSAETTEIRKGLRERRKRERESGKFAVISYDKLVICDWTAKK
ncbi:uncharacterized protein LOC136085583 [Hydra vulgaris]|uniref:Uncharacterized protein LOC136085583 n=1 Tax=Hydra vulgaris TaxID=6087 RepID=A0ABM4CME5_HYDVU